MSIIRRRLASGALALTVLQLLSLFTAPISACCAPNAGHATIAASAGALECCPAGSHAPGQCPLHKASKAGASATRTDPPCRMQCDASHGPQFVPGAIGVLPAPNVTTVSLASDPLPLVASTPIHTRPAIPDPQPPELL